MRSEKKYIVLVRGEKGEDYESFGIRVRQLAGLWVQDGSASTVKICLTVETPPGLSVIPFRKTKAAIISIYRKEDLATDNFDGSFSGVYQVEEALPVSYSKSWADGELTPGICLLTLFRRKSSIDYNTFIDRWHNGHTPLSLKIHPLWHYSRNVVKESLLEGSEIFDGIVDEHFKQPSQLLNPFQFFGNAFIIIPRMIKVYADVRSFLDYKSIESYLTREIYLKSAEDQ